MPQVLKNLFSSEKGLLAVLCLVAITVLAALGKMTVPEWRDTMLWIVGIYTGGKTVTGAVTAMTGRPTVLHATSSEKSPDKPSP